MSTRAWTYPDLRNGTTFNHITDSHFGAHGNADWLHQWMYRMRDDLVDLAGSHVGHVHSGDCIHWDSIGDELIEDPWFVEWRGAIKAADGLPWSVAEGNHDIACLGDTDGTNRRTGTQWARAVNVPAQNTVTDIGGMKVIAIGPDSRPEGVGWVMTAETMAFLDAELTRAGSTPCWVNCHTPLAEQYPNPNFTNMWNTDVANPQFFPILEAHPNAVGYLSGHLHTDIRPQTNWCRPVNIGSRSIFSINGPPAGGGRLGAVAYANHQWQSPCQSTFITYLGDAIVVRVRDHLHRTWQTTKGNVSLTVTLP